MPTSIYSNPVYETYMCFSLSCSSGNNKWLLFKAWKIRTFAFHVNMNPVCLHRLAFPTTGSVPLSITLICINRPYCCKGSNMLRAWRGVREDQLSAISAGAEWEHEGWSEGDWKTGSHRSLLHSIYSRIINEQAWKERGYWCINNHFVGLLKH